MSVFAAACEAAGLSRPEPEYRFCKDRRWRADWAFLKEKVAVEIQGGLHVGGRHTRGAALEREYEKLNELAIMGFRVLLVTPEQFERGDVVGLVARAVCAKE